jgi:glycosyltransferase involved in cell wall biosynthesis
LELVARGSEYLIEFKTTVSIVMCVRNVEKFIDDCLRSILNQTFNDFELLVIDDLSNDQTRQKIEMFNDKRIRFYRNEEWLGIAKSRNKALNLARGEYVFFTDGDCVLTRNWIKIGLGNFKDRNCVGVEGKTCYVSEEYRPTRSDAVTENKKGGKFMTCNIAYKKSVLEKIGGFDERFVYFDDRDLALRAQKFGRICFNPEMMVFHRQITLSPGQFVKHCRRIRDQVYLYKKFKDKSLFMWRIISPLNLIVIMFPPLVFGGLLHGTYKKKADFALLPFVYVRYICERLNFWDMCIKERVFLI